MISIPPFQVLEQPCEEATAWVTKQLGDLGLRVVVTFDLRIARIAHTDCPCPHHGTDQCDCQLNVLLVYKTGFAPVTLLAHGHDGRTWLSLVNTPQQPVDPRLVALIRKNLIPLPEGQMEQPHAA
ncbi:MAG: hypothetical protein Q8N46_07130 [Anaerolineales bacterium]|nr:hypothetical protein [Anaerolineales bacterium]